MADDEWACFQTPAASSTKKMQVMAAAQQVKSRKQEDDEENEDDWGDVKTSAAFKINANSNEEAKMEYLQRQ